MYLNAFHGEYQSPCIFKVIRVSSCECTSPNLVYRLSRYKEVFKSELVILIRNACRKTIYSF